jgi:hypothetical protein
MADEGRAGICAIPQTISEDSTAGTAAIRNIPSGNSVNYYNTVVAKLGKDTVHAGIRFYLVPGMNHCFGGEGGFPDRLAGCG